MSSRYSNKRIVKKTNRNTEKLLKSRDLKAINIVEALSVKPLTDRERSKYQVRTVIWKTSTKMYKLAHYFYGDSRLWWAIAWFNQRPTDAHYVPGDVVYVPFPIENIIQRLR